MGYFRTCPHCGANLDPGETCDCQERYHKPAPERDSKPVPEPRRESNTANDTLRDLRINNKIPVKEMVEIVKRFYPRFDRTTQSKCEHGRECGIDIKPRALDALLAEYAPEQLEAERHRRDGYHRLKRRITCRLEDGEYNALTKRIREDGFDTVQSWLTWIVRNYLRKEQKNEG